MVNSSIKRDYLCSLSYQVFQWVSPLITVPYLSRVLGPDGVGTVSYAESIVSYFVLFAALGITFYGQREISYLQDDIRQRSIVFWETKLFQLFSSGIVLLLYIPFCFFQRNPYLALILSLRIVAVMTDITWFFQGMQEFAKIVARSFFFRLLGILFIFAFIKTKDDLNIFVLGTSGLTVLCNLSLWMLLPGFITSVRRSEFRILEKARPIFALFIPSITISVYTVLDKTMIGLITKSEFENGYYEQAIKISRMALAIITTLGTVMIPRIGHHYGKGDFEQVKRFMYRGYRFIWLLGVPLTFGLFCCADNFVPWFFGSGYGKVIPLLKILCFLILIVGLSNITGVQYLIATKRENEFTISVLAGACINFVLNSILIRHFQSVGAAAASIAAETGVSAVLLYDVRRELDLREIFRTSWKYLAAGGVMSMLLLVLNSVFSPTALHTMIMITGGACTYAVVILLLRDSYALGLCKQFRDRFGIGKKRI